MGLVKADKHLIHIDEAGPSHPKTKGLTSGLEMTLTPPAIAASQSPSNRARQAWWMATVDEEHAVSITIDGPLRPRQYDKRPLRKDFKVPGRHHQLFVLSPATDRHTCCVVYINALRQIVNIIMGSCSNVTSKRIS